MCLAVAAAVAVAVDAGDRHRLTFFVSAEVNASHADHRILDDVLSKTMRCRSRQIWSKRRITCNTILT